MAGAASSAGRGQAVVVAAALAACWAPACSPAGVARSSDPNVQVPAHQMLDPGELPLVPLGKPDTMDSDIPGPPLSPADFEKSEKMVHAAVDTSAQPDPIELAGLYQGDIILNRMDDMGGSRKDLPIQRVANPPRLRNAMIDLSRRWVNGVIPYVISSSYNANERATIAEAINQYHTHTCLRFVPRTRQRDYIHLLKGDGCSSSVGRVGGAQKVSLGPGCLYAGIVMHELMHVAGFWHEQSRNDRDNHITINKLNVQDSMWYNFEKYSWEKIQSLGVDYDLGSVMHYGPYAFAKDRTRPTIIPRETGVEIGQRRGFSKRDILKLQRMYECDNATALPYSVTTDSPSTTLTPGECMDHSTHCQTWGLAGECANNPTWMNVNCMQACGQCGKECQDQSPLCSFWTEVGECTKNPSYMTIFCKASCGLCETAGATPAPGSGAPCHDAHRYCGAWADGGQCRANPEYMLQFCSRACAQC